MIEKCIPEELAELINDLPISDTIGIIESSRLIITNDGQPYELVKEDIQRAIGSPRAIKLLRTAIKGRRVNIELEAVEISDEIQEALERAFDSVDAL